MAGTVSYLILLMINYMLLGCNCSSKHIIRSMYKPYGPNMCDELGKESNDTLRYIKEDLACYRFQKGLPYCPNISKKTNMSLEHKQRPITCREGRTAPREDYRFVTSRETKLYVKYHNENKTWHDALKICQSEGGNLLKIDSEARKSIFKQLQDITKSLRKANSWVGLSRLTKNQQWMWSDGTPATNLKWSKSPFGLKYIPTGTCAVGINMYISIAVDDVACKSYNKFICELSGI